MLRKSLVPVGIVIVLSAWTLFYRLGDANLYHIRNEARRARIAQEMLDTGNALIPRLEGVPILTKPPLFYWAAMLCSRDGRVTELSARLPSALAGIGIAILVYLIGCLLFDRRVGFYSAAVLIGTQFFMHYARYAELDGLLALFVTAAVFCFLKGCREPERGTLWFALSCAMMGLGMITKGPFALTFPLIPAVGHLWACGRLRQLFRKPLLVGLLLFFIIVLPWPLVIMRYYPQFPLLVFWETIYRAATGYVHREPFYYYVGELITALFPWIFFLPVGLCLIWSERLKPWKESNRFLLFWFVGNLLFLSLLKSKRGYYMFGFIPAVALLTGATWQACWDWFAEKVPGKASARRLAFAVGAACAAGSFLAGNPFAVNFPEMHFPGGACLLLFAGLGIMAVVCARALMPRVGLAQLALAGIVVLMLAAHGMYQTLAVPIRNAEESGKNFYIAAAHIVPTEVPLALAGGNENYAFTFYARRPLITLKNDEQLKNFLAQDQESYLAMTRREYNKFRPQGWRVAFTTDFAEHRSWGGYVLLHNR